MVNVQTPVSLPANSAVALPNAATEQSRLVLSDLAFPKGCCTHLASVVNYSIGLSSVVESSFLTWLFAFTGYWSIFLPNNVYIPLSATVLGIMPKLRQILPNIQRLPQETSYVGLIIDSISTTYTKTQHYEFETNH